jgi:hypothetical protein
MQRISSYGPPKYTPPTKSAPSSSVAEKEGNSKSNKHCDRQPLDPSARLQIAEKILHDESAIRSKLNLQSSSRASSQPTPITKEQIETIKQLIPYGVKAQRIIPGTNGKVAILGRSMGDMTRADKTEPGVVDFQHALDSKGFKTERFGGDMVKQEWRDEMAALGKIHGKPGRPGSNFWILPDDIIKNSVVFKENMKWVQKLKDEGYTIVDIGNPNNKGSSVYYDNEVKLAFKHNEDNKTQSYI